MADRTIRRGIVLWTSTPPGLRLVLSREFDVGQGDIRGMGDAELRVESRSTDALGNPSWSSAMETIADSRLLSILEETVVLHQCGELEDEIRRELQAATTEDGDGGQLGSVRDHEPTLTGGHFGPQGGVDD